MDVGFVGLMKYIQENVAHNITLLNSLEQNYLQGAVPHYES